MPVVVLLCMITELISKFFDPWKNKEEQKNRTKQKNGNLKSKTKIWLFWAAHIVKWGRKAGVMPYKKLFS